MATLGACLVAILGMAAFSVAHLTNEVGFTFALRQTFDSPLIVLIQAAFLWIPLVIGGLLTTLGSAIAWIFYRQIPMPLWLTGFWGAASGAIGLFPIVVAFHDPDDYPDATCRPFIEDIVFATPINASLPPCSLLDEFDLRATMTLVFPVLAVGILAGLAFWRIARPRPNLDIEQ